MSQQEGVARSSSSHEPPEGSAPPSSPITSLQALASELRAAESTEEVDGVVRRLAASIVGAEDARLVRGEGVQPPDNEHPASPEDGPVWIPIDSDDPEHDVLMVTFSEPTDLEPAQVELLRLEATMAAHSLDRLAAIKEERGRRERSEVLQHLALACAGARDPVDVARALVDVLVESGVASAEVSVGGQGTHTTFRRQVGEHRSGGPDVVLDLAPHGVANDASEPEGDGPTGRLRATIPAGSHLDRRHDAFWRALARIAGDALARVRRFAELEDLARQDPLTALPNRRAFDEYLRRGLVRLQRVDDLLAVVYVDIDNFKEVNDRFGHHVGDELLVRVAATLRDVLRPTDVAARLGGDEFAVLAESIGSEADARALAERIRTSIASRVGSSSGAEVTASVGLALTRRADEDPDGLVAQADRAMYAAKRAGATGDQRLSVRPTC